MATKPSSVRPPHRRIRWTGALHLIIALPDLAACRCAPRGVVRRPDRHTRAIVYPASVRLARNRPPVDPMPDARLCSIDTGCRDSATWHGGRCWPPACPPPGKRCEHRRRHLARRPAVVAAGPRRSRPSALRPAVRDRRPAPEQHEPPPDTTASSRAVVDTLRCPRIRDDATRILRQPPTEARSPVATRFARDGDEAWWAPAAQCRRQAQR